VLLFAIQAPLLGPKAFGLISIVMVFVGFCEYVPGEAAAEALISVREIEDEHFHTMTAFNVLLSRDRRRRFHHGPAHCRLVRRPGTDPPPALHVVLPAISAFAAAPTAATKRDMEFRPLALRSMGSLSRRNPGIDLDAVRAGVWAWSGRPSSRGWWIHRPLVHRAAPVRHAVLRAPLSGAGPLCGADHAVALPHLELQPDSSGDARLYWGSTELGLFSLAARLGTSSWRWRWCPVRGGARRTAKVRGGSRRTVGRARAHLHVHDRVLLSTMRGGAAIVPTLFHVWLDPGGPAPLRPPNACC